MLDQEEKKTVAELNGLLAEARVLDEAQWRRAWNLVHLLVDAAWPRSLSRCIALGYSRTDMFAEFFSQQFFLRAASQPLPLVASAGALRGWWSHFCSDIMRHHKRWTDLAVQAENASCMLDGAGLSSAQRQRIGISARAFLQTLDPGHRAMVREYLCADPDHGQTLLSVARRWRIRSYHYRARQLGLGGLRPGSTADFARSAIGRWLSSLGYATAPGTEGASPDELRAAIEVLCVEAVARPEEPEMPEMPEERHA